MMMMMKMPKINLRNLTSTFLLLTSFFSALSAPLKPLNERSKELTWQAWLLVDDQNQNKQQYDPDGLIRRRITPKSVFIAPTFSPSDLPACADGYTSDSMGRCVKLIQLDENAHLNYILERLREQFGNFSEDDYDDEVDEEKPTPGPFQFNIPLEDVEQEGSSDDTNVAIVVAPTNGSFNLTMNDFKINNVKRDQNGTDPLGVPIIITKINVDNSDEKNTEDGGETTTTEVAETTTAEIDTTTMAEEQAIFFKIPHNRTKTPAENFDSVTSENKQTLNIVKFPEVPMQDSASSDHPALPNHQLLPLVDTKHIFRDGDAKDIISQLLPHANVKTTDTLFDELLQNTDSNVQHNFKHRDTSHQSTDKPPHRIFNHRNRDKWLFPPAWRDSPPQKPLVLRFNHLPSNTQNTHFYDHQPRQEGMYRKVPPQDLSYIFGFKDGHR